jgi:hypothetical protein
VQILKLKEVFVEYPGVGGGVLPIESALQKAANPQER